MIDLLLSNPLYLAGAVLLLMLAVFILWKIIKGVGMVVIILILLAGIFAAIILLQRMG